MAESTREDSVIAAVMCFNPIPTQRLPSNAQLAVVDAESVASCMGAPICPMPARPRPDLRQAASLVHGSRCLPVQVMAWRFGGKTNRKRAAMLLCCSDICFDRGTQGLEPGFEGLGSGRQGLELGFQGLG